MTDYDNGFQDGYIAALKTYGINRDGEQFIGTMQHNVKDLARKITGGNDNWFNTERKLAKQRREAKPPARSAPPSHESCVEPCDWCLGEQQ